MALKEAWGACVNCGAHHFKMMDKSLDLAEGSMGVKILECQDCGHPHVFDSKSNNLTWLLGQCNHGSHLSKIEIINARIKSQIDETTERSSGASYCEICGTIFIFDADRMKEIRPMAARIEIALLPKSH